MDRQASGDASDSPGDSHEHLHMWRFTAVELADDGAHSEYVCDLCGDELHVGPGEIPPLES